MVTLRKFKYLASQCAAAESPTRSPSRSPVVHFRRQKTLRMLLSRSASGGGRLLRGEIQCSPDRKQIARDPNRPSKNIAARHKLKDLFVSSPPPPEMRDSDKSRGASEILSMANPRAGVGGGSRLFSAALRSRLLRRAWRPMLVTIPE